MSEVADGEERDADYLKKIKWIIKEDGAWEVLEDGQVVDPRVALGVEDSERTSRAVRGMVGKR